MFENLSERLSNVFDRLTKQGALSEDNVKTALREVRVALLEADVSIAVARDFVNAVQTKATGQAVTKSVTPGQQVVKIVHDELIHVLTGEDDPGALKIDSAPAPILMVGLQGSGKTTFSAKLANYLKIKQDKSPLMVAGDVYRPAAIDQLKVLGEQIGVEVYSEEDNKSPVDIAKNAVKHAKANGNNIVIVDTAGRLAVDEEMMNEISSVKKAIGPDEILFVVDAMTGQDAVNTAKAFNDRLDFDGVVLTKLDGDTRGGAALTIKSVVDKPIKFVGIGEKMEAIDLFHPSRMADRILGMGDIVTLVEKAQEQYDVEEARKLQKKIAKNQFNFNDFLKQIQQIKKMGNVKDLMGMIPGVGKAIKDTDIDDDAFKGIEAIIYSMTMDERENPKILNGSRRKRIARGAGTDIQEVNRLIKQFAETSKMMKMMTTGGGRKMANMMNQLKK